ncbi:XRE family transcriptional regulator [Kibdelosporangium phytohabitans]|uniref:XRE family transcriptional regulator n=1 Tax=Kibdelosporangium phytohabitans TaxID=860235 RepID=A0A0N7F595_9PSEU|nr:helix-turn-helix transcriptional regulator [Kibdelosporangium phytohabitans]ALG13607.1 XRE family transcriptional regulator [Kibdelosporangium phytohabitans]
MDVSNELGEFLRTRRARITPEEVGLPRAGRRRVPGLRRDELARLAGVSVEYYTRLEQGRSPNVSEPVLDAIANALSLNETEREHLRILVRPARRARPSPRGARVRPAVRMMLDQMDRMPAFVFGPTLDVLAWNRLGDAISGYSATDRPNLCRTVFLDPGARDFYPQWACVAEDTVAVLRWMATRDPGAPGLATLIGELSLHSQEFRDLWAKHDVKEKTAGAKRMNHPIAGELDLFYESFPLPGQATDMVLVTYVAEPGSPTAEKLSLLASWSQPEHERVAPERGGVTGSADRLED